MPNMLTRFFALFTLVSYLLVGSVAVRFMVSENTSVSFSETYLNLFTQVSLNNEFNVEEIRSPEIVFSDIKIPVEATKMAQMKIVKVAVVKRDVVEVVEVAAPVLERNELPFHEPVILQKIVSYNVLDHDLVSLYKDFAYNDTQLAKADIQVDAIKTVQSSVEVAEPEFFEYPTEKKVEPVKEEKVVAQTNKTEMTQENITEKKTVKVEADQPVASIVDESISEIAASMQAQPENIEPELSADIQPAFDTDRPIEAAVAPINQTEMDNEIVAFDYSKATKDVNNQVIPTYSALTTQIPAINQPIGTGLAVAEAPKTKRAAATQTAVSNSSPKSNEPQAETAETDMAKSVQKNAFTAPIEIPKYSVNLSVQVTGSDLKNTEALKGFEVRFQDDLSENLGDYGTGEVLVKAELSQPKMTRSMTLLKRGFMPTSSDVILEDGTGSVSLPMIEEETFNNLQQKYEGRDPIGSVLVELDDESDLAQLDVSFGEVIKLDGDLKKTDSEDYRYQLFMGVKAGNALLTYKRANGEAISKIIHVHENEITYDANFYEDVIDEKVRLYEEDLLGRESSPLIISGDQVQVFATTNMAKKINNHTYKMDFGSTHLAGRRYIELNHQSEPIFVGIRDNNHVTVPSENFMRFILSKVEGQKLGNRCLIQVNLTKKAEKLEVGSESVAASLMTTSQMLDNDGKFYDSLSEKTQKIIVIGENQGAPGISPDAKINIKIDYLDGTTQFLNSYCSPNTYLVEQL